MEKDTNPKDAIGRAKWRNYFTVPRQVLWALGIAMLEGALKYGRHNYRGAGVRASVYVDAAMGHIDQWVEGEDNDPDSEANLSHIIKAIASLTVLADAIMNDFLDDDRPPKIKDLPGLRAQLQEAADRLHDEHADKNPHHYSHLEDGEPYRDNWNAEQADFDDDEILASPRISVSFAPPSIESCAAHVEDPTYLPGILKCLSDDDPDQILYLSPQHPEYDQAHIVEGLTMKQIDRLVAHEADQIGCLLVDGDEVVFDAVLRRVLLRLKERLQLWHTVYFAQGGTDRRFSRLRNAEWQIAIPGCIADPDMMPRTFA